MESREYVHPDDSKVGEIYGYKDVTVLSRAMPLSRDFNFDFIKNLVKIVNENNIDAIILSHPSGAMITKLILALLGKKVPVIYDAHNVESNFTREIFGFNDSYSKLEQFLIPFYVSALERISCKYLFDHIMTVSKKDKDTFIKTYHLNEKVSVIPSGCSLRPLLSISERSKLKEKYGLDPNSKVVIFHGSYSHPANEEAFRLIKDIIAPKFVDRDVVFLVGGSGVPILEKSNFKSIGFIEDLWEFLSVADMAIAPILRGGGTKLKLMDYLSAGLPIVTTGKGIEGIDAVNNEHVMVVDSVDDRFIGKIGYLIENEEEMIRIGGNARKLAEKSYDWNVIGDELDNFLCEEIFGS